MKTPGTDTPGYALSGAQGHPQSTDVLSIFSQSPPSPTVVVGAAHCTYLCKDRGREVPTCCCSSDTDACKERNKKCGNNPEVEEMDGPDSEVICGEWDSSMATGDTTGERFNVVLPVVKILRHPDFDPAKGPINGGDMVVFKVDDKSIQNNTAYSCNRTSSIFFHTITSSRIWNILQQLLQAMALQDGYF